MSRPTNTPFNRHYIFSLAKTDRYLEIDPGSRQPKPFELERGRIRRKVDAYRERHELDGLTREVWD